MQCNVLDANAPAMCQGYIKKQGHVVRNWKRRYFVLRDGVLAYYESPDPFPPYGKKKKGEIVLKGYKVTSSTSINLYVYCDDAASTGEDKDMHLETENSSERDRWLSALKEHAAYASR